MKKSFSLLCLLAFAAAPSSALEWATMGPQAMAMGGAGVANVQGPLAAYWNPAALGHPGQDSNYGLAAQFSAEADIVGPVVQGAKDLQQLNDNCPGPNCTQSAIDKAISDLNHPGEGLSAFANASAGLKIGPVTAFFNDFVELGAQPIVDTTHTSATPGPNFISNNTSQLVIRGASIQELGAGFGHELPFVPGLYVGGDIKLMRAQVGDSSFFLLQNNNVNSNLFQDLKNNSTTSGNVGLDAGALWDIDRTWDVLPFSPRAGITYRNINNPKFDAPGGGHFAVNPQLRAGASLSPFNWWHLVGDVDLTRNLTPLDGYQSQMLGVGTEIDLVNRPGLNLPLRVGLKHNLADPGTGVTYTLGTGLNLLHFMIDVAGEAGNQSTTVQSQGNTTKVPNEFGASVQLSFLFGGSNDRPAHASTVTPSAPPPPAAGALPQSDADRIRANAEKAQQQLNQQTVH